LQKPETAAAVAAIEILRALASDKRLEILAWLKAPRAHFPEQVDGDLVEDGVCAVSIAGKLGVSNSTLSEHMRILAGAGLVRGKKIKQWIFYKREEGAIAAALRAIRDAV
jgi:ArsR family transcriptional regulator